MNILEALDTMYEVKGDAQNTAAANRELQKQKSHLMHDPKQRREYKSFKKYEHDPYRTSDPTPMRTADDYRNRSSKVQTTRNYLDMAEKNDKTERDARKSRKCTETVDTLEGIL